MALTQVDQGLLGQYAQYTGFKNRIINGAMMIDQRNAGASITPTTTGTYSVDRWRCGLSVASKYSAQQSSTAPTGFKNSLLITSTSAYSVGASETFNLTQYIEGYNIADLGWGSASAATVTLSFWVRSSLTGTFGGSLRNNNTDRAYPFTYTISSANTWEQKTVTVAGDTSGTWATDNNAGIAVTFSLGSGSTYNGTANTWQAGNLLSVSGATSVVGTNAATFYITGVQLEKGSTGTSFDFRSYGQELALCQRYCINYNSATANGSYYRFAYGECPSTTTLQAAYSFPVQMRITPSLTAASASSYTVYSRNTLITCSVSPTFGADGSTNQTAYVNGVVSSGLTAGSGGSLAANGNNTAYLLFTAEL